MVLFFNIVLFIIGSIGWSIKKTVHNVYTGNLTYNPKTGTHYDMFGVERDSYGDYCKTERLINGDLVQTDKYNNIIRNFSKEKRDIENSDPNRTVIRMSEKNLYSNYCDYPIGTRYIDKKTNAEYVIRSFRVDVSKTKGYSVYFYMHTSNALLERITDGEILNGDLKDGERINRFICEFNEIQKTKKYFSIDDKYHNGHSSDYDIGFRNSKLDQINNYY